MENSHTEMGTANCPNCTFVYAQLMDKYST